MGDASDDLLSRRDQSVVLWLFDLVAEADEPLTFAEVLGACEQQGMVRKTASNLIGEMHRFGAVYKARQRFKSSPDFDRVRPTALGLLWRDVVRGDEVDWPRPWDDRAPSGLMAAAGVVAAEAPGLQASILAELVADVEKELGRWADFTDVVESEACVDMAAAYPQPAEAFAKLVVAVWEQLD